jgi:ribosomal protein S18 acetylase RimI-like enzyme
MDVMARYDAINRATAQFDPGRPHIHLNMLGVLRSHRGAGLGRRLLDATQELSGGRAASDGVALVTADAANARYYCGLGFEEVGHTALAPGPELWVYFRADEAAAGRRPQ